MEVCIPSGHRPKTVPRQAEHRLCIMNGWEIDVFLMISQILQWTLDTTRYKTITIGKWGTKNPILYCLKIYNLHLLICSTVLTMQFSYTDGTPNQNDELRAPTGAKQTTASQKYQFIIIPSSIFWEMGLAQIQCNCIYPQYPKYSPMMSPVLRRFTRWLRRRRDARQEDRHRPWNRRAHFSGGGLPAS